MIYIYTSYYIYVYYIIHRYLTGRSGKWPKHVPAEVALPPGASPPFCPAKMSTPILADPHSSIRTAWCRV